MKGYFTIENDKEFCDRVFKAGEKYRIIKETETYIIVKSQNSEEQLMTKLWLEKGMFNFLTFHDAE